ncbi:hypothetical protein scyTo_0024262, partial [Scyliorhinus torazame]|nr:hypothetical protein [Scyliorhinus torazame]
GWNQTSCVATAASALMPGILTTAGVRRVTPAATARSRWMNARQTPAKTEPPVPITWAATPASALQAITG